MTKEQLIDQMISDVLDDFNFNEVHDVMKFLDWKWYRNGVEEVPNLYQLIKQAESLLRDVAKHYGDKKSHVVETGGFRATLDDDCLGLDFILTESTSYVEYYKEL